LKPGRAYARLGDLASQVGWKHEELIKRLESKRKEKSAAFYKVKKELIKKKKQAQTNVHKQLEAIAQPLAQFGYPLQA